MDDTISAATASSIGTGMNSGVEADADVDLGLLLAQTDGLGGLEPSSGGNLTPREFNGTVPNARDLPVNAGEEGATEQGEIASAMRGSVIGANGAFYQPENGNIVPQVLGDGLAFTPEEGAAAPTGETIVTVNGVTVSPAVAYANAQAVANETGANVVAIYNGPDANLGRGLGRFQEFGGAIAHKTNNNGIDDDLAAQNIAQVIIDQIESGEPGEEITLVPHSEGSAYARAGMDVAKTRLLEADPSLTPEEADQLIADNVNLVSLGAGTTRFPPAADGTHYLHLDDIIIGNLGIGRAWGSESRVILSVEDAPGDGLNRNHAAATYIPNIDPSHQALPPGFYFQDNETGETLALAIDQILTFRDAEWIATHRLVAVDEKGDFLRVVYEQGDEEWQNGFGSRLGHLYRLAVLSDADRQEIADGEFGDTGVVNRIRLNEVPAGADDGLRLNGFFDERIYSEEPGGVTASGVGVFTPAAIVAAGGEGGAGAPYDVDPETSGLLLSETELTAEDRAGVADDPFLVSQISAFALDGNASIDRSTEDGVQQGAAFDLEVRDLVLSNPYLSQSDVETLSAALFVDPGAGLYILHPPSSLSPEQQVFRDAVNELPEGPDNAAQVAAAFDAYLLTPSADGLIVNAEGRDAAFGATTAETVDEAAYVAVHDYTFDRNARLLLLAEGQPETEAGAVARADLEAQGLVFLPNGLLDRSAGSGKSQLSSLSFAAATDPETNTAVQGLIDAGLTEAEAAASVIDPAVPVEPTAPPEEAAPAPLPALTPEEARAEVIRQIDEQLSRAEAEGDLAEIFFFTVIGDAVALGDTSNADPAFFANLLNLNDGLFTELLGRIGGDDVGAFGQLLPAIGAEVVRAGADIGEVEIAGFGIGALFGQALQLEAQAGEGKDGLFVAGVAIEAASQSFVEILRGSTRSQEIVGADGTTITQEVEVDLGIVVADIGVDAANSLLQFFGDKYDVDLLTQIGSGADLGWEIFKVLDDKAVAGDLIDPAGNFIGSFLPDGALSDIREGIGFGREAVGLFTGSGPRFEALEQVGLGGLGRSLDSSSFYKTGGTVAGAAALVVEGLERLGVEVPDEVSFAVETAAKAFAGPFGWAAIAFDVLQRIFSIGTWTETTPYWLNIDADADRLRDDQGNIVTTLEQGFFGGAEVVDSEIQYEVSGVNPDLLEHATFELWGSVEFPQGFLGGSSDRHRVRIEASDLTDGGGFPGLPVQYYVSISGRYNGLNPDTDGESFQRGLFVTEDEFNAMIAELGEAGPVTLAGDDPRLVAGANGAIPGGGADTVLADVMSRLEITFNSESRNPNIYQYQDVNGDGTPDLIRYGIRQDGDGLHSGDERFEITLMGQDGEPLGIRDAAGSSVNGEGATYNQVPSIVSESLDEAVLIGSLTHYLMPWAAARPELAIYGHDPVSIFRAVEDAGHLDEIVAVRDADLAARQASGQAVNDIVAAVEADGGDGAALTPEQEAYHSGQIAAAAELSLQKAEILAELGLFDVNAYAAANPEIAARYNGNPIELAYHYMAEGNAQALPIDADGATLAAGPGPAWPGIVSLGSSLEAGERLSKDQMLLSQNGRFAAVFRENGDFRTFDLSSGAAVEVWSPDIDGRTDDGWVEVTAEGEFRIRDNDGSVEFSTNTGAENAHGNYSLVLSNDGHLNLVDLEANTILWAGGASEGFDRGGDGVQLGVAGPAFVDPAADRGAGSDLVIVASGQIETGVLSAGEALLSPNGAHALEVTTDGTVRIVDNATGTYRLLSNDAVDLGPAATLHIRGDGELWALGSDGDLAWHPGTGTAGVDRTMYLRLHDDGSLVLVDSQFNQPLWTDGGGVIGRAEPDVAVLGTTLTAGDASGGVLSRGQAIVSEDGRSVLMLTSGGQLIVHDAATQAANVIDEGGATLTMQLDGNLVLQDEAGGVVWDTGTHQSAVADPGAAAFSVTVASDGVAVLTDARSNDVLWTS
ncbi:MAG: hypothetical protein AAGE90_07955 [Pseudomonadota bacterium]